jgi:hypothetical protein
MASNRLRNAEKQAAELGLGENAAERRRGNLLKQFRTWLQQQLSHMGGLRTLPDFIQRNLYFLSFLTFIGLFYIWNSHSAERKVRRIDKIDQELRELRAEQMTMNAGLSQSRKQSHIAPLADSLIGLKHSTAPPIVLGQTKP